MTPSCGSPGREALPLERQEPRQGRERRVDAVDRGQLVGPNALGVQDPFAPDPLGSPFRRQGAGQDHRRRVREHLQGASLRRAGSVRGEAVLVRDAEHLEPHFHPREERVAASLGLGRRVERLDVAGRQLAFGPSRAPGGGPSRRGVDRHDVRTELVDQRADLEGPHVRPHRERHPPLVHQHEVQSLRDADVDPERTHGRVRASVAGGPGSRAGRSASTRPGPVPPSSRARRARARALRTRTRSGRRTRPSGSAAP